MNKKHGKVLKGRETGEWLKWYFLEDGENIDRREQYEEKEKYFDQVEKKLSHVEETKGQIQEERILNW